MQHNLYVVVIQLQHWQSLSGASTECPVVQGCFSTCSGTDIECLLILWVLQWFFSLYFASLLYYQQIFYHLSHQGSPFQFFQHVVPWQLSLYGLIECHPVQCREGLHQSLKGIPMKISGALILCTSHSLVFCATDSSCLSSLHS